MGKIEKRIEVTVTEDMAPFTYECKVYEAGETVMVRPFDYCGKLEPVITEAPLQGCWPDYCDTGKGAYPILANRNQYIIPAGETVVVAIPDRGVPCGKPGRVYFNWCGSCFVVQFNKPAPEGEVTDLSAGVINPRFLDVSVDSAGDPVDTIHVTNKGETELCLSAAWYC